MYSEGRSEAMDCYQQVANASVLEDTSPHRLIQLLMEHALNRMNFAVGYIERGDIAQKGKAISDAINVLNGLQASLNHSSNTRISENFDALYAYMMRRLLEANLKNDVSIVQEVSGLLRELKEAWDAIADDPAVLEMTAAAS